LSDSTYRCMQLAWVFFSQCWNKERDDAHVFWSKGEKKKMQQNFLWESEHHYLGLTWNSCILHLPSLSLYIYICLECVPTTHLSFRKWFGKPKLISYI
jgi:hypothetical protein